MESIKFSIIIPLYNCEKYIKDCLNSIQLQTYENWEIIVVDDGSTDKSNEIGMDIASNDKRILLKTQTNQGPYMARMSGIKETKGDYLLFVDADDELKSDALLCLNNIVSQYNPDIIMFNMSTNREFSNTIINYSFDNGTLFEKDKQPLYEEIITTSNINNLATKCIRRSLVDSISFNEYEKFNNGEDLYVCLPLIDKAKRVYLLNESLYFYRSIITSTTHNYNKTLFTSIARVNTKKVEYAEKWGGTRLSMLAKRRCCLSCLFTINSLIISNLSKKEKTSELKRIYSSEFFNTYIKYKPDNMGIILKTIYWLVNRENCLLRFGALFGFCLCSNALVHKESI